MKIVVTGGAGFIGSHIVDKLVKDGNEVTVVDRLEKQVHQGNKPSYLNKEAEYIFDDFSRPDVMKTALEGAEVLMHKAASGGVGKSMYQISEYIDNNTMATAKLCHFLANEEHDIKKLIVASSMSIYGDGAYECEKHGRVFPSWRTETQLKAKDWEMKCPECTKPVKPVPTAEDKPPIPTSVYAITKRDQEELCLVTGRAYGIDTTALRYFNVYGPRQSLNNPYTGVTAIFSSRIKNNNPPIIFEDGEQSRDFISVHDISAANLAVMKSTAAKDKVFNVGTGKQTTILQIAETLNSLYGRDLKPQIENRHRFGDIRHCFSDSSKLREKTGWAPKVDLKNGMKELVEWGERISAVDSSNDAFKELEDRNLTR